MEAPTSNPTLHQAPGQAQSGHSTDQAAAPGGPAPENPAPGVSPGQAAAADHQAPPAGQARETVNPAGTTAQGIHPDYAGQSQAAPGVQQPETGQAQGMAAQPTGLVMDPRTGQLYYTYAVPAGMAVQSSLGQAPYQAQDPAAAQQAPPDYARVIKSVEDFAEGDATVADVVKTLYSETSQDDQFWKGALVGAAATVLLTNKSVKNAMGKTFGGIFGGTVKKDEG